MKLLHSSARIEGRRREERRMGEQVGDWAVWARVKRRGERSGGR